MGKNDSTNLQLHQSQLPTSNTHSSALFCRRCAVRFAHQFSFKCVLVLILSLCLLVSGIFWIFPFGQIQHQLNSFDAAESVKLSATVQASFCLQKPVSQLIPNIGKLEYDIFEEIGVPNTKVAILSMHESGSSNCSKVVFGVLSNPIIDVPINIVPLSILRSSLIDLFLKEYNLTLTNSTFGQSSGFEILKFPGGITVVPQYTSIWQIQQILFNFTLNNSILEILENLAELKDQLKSGLHLLPYENVAVQLTNMDGSTVDPPVTVQASVITDMGNLLPQRLKQLAQMITNSPARNLGLDNSIFGKVKSVILSSYLKGTLHETPSSPSPAPSPELNDYAEPPVLPSPAPSPGSTDPCPNSPYDGPCHSLPPVNAPAPSIVAHPSHPCPDHGFGIPPTPGSPSPHPNPDRFQPAGPPSYSMPPRLYTIPESETAPSPMAPSPLSSTPGPCHGEVWLFGLSGLLIFHLMVNPH